MPGLLEGGALPDINVVSAADGRSALYLATASGHETAAMRLVVAGANVHFRDPVDGCDVLYKAVEGGLSQLTDLVLVAGASTQTRGKGGSSPLHIAAGAGSVSITEALLIRGADKDARDDVRDTPLIKAAREGHEGVVNRLLTAGADVGIDGEGGYQAAARAIERGHVGVLKVLIRHGMEANGAVVNLGVPAILTLPALYMAAWRNQAAAIDVLVEAGADVELDWNHTSPLLYCTRRCSVRAMRALLDHGAAPNRAPMKPSGIECCPLHMVCHRQLNGVAEAVDLLLRAGADEVLSGEIISMLTFNRRRMTPAQILDEPRRPQLNDNVDEACSPEEKEWARVLLARAPNDRAWRRRGWLAMLRSRRAEEATSDPGCCGRGGKFKAATAEHAGELESIFGAAVEVLIGLRPEGVFRNVVGFL